MSLGAARGLGVGLLALGVAVPGMVMGLRRVLEQGEAREQWRPALVKVPAGTFMMGSPEDEPGRQENERLHEVTLTHDFYICRTEVTQAQWVAVMGENPSDCAYGCGDDVAVHNVSWEMSVGYLNALSEREGLEPCYSRDDTDWVWDKSCDGYRLPTEAEWEHAARAGSQTMYSFGDDVGALAEHAWYVESSGDMAQPVAQKRPNAWGLYDVHGNVWEWVWDWYDEDLESYAQIDPAGPETGSGRTLRSGSFEGVASRVRSAMRNNVFPGFQRMYYGLRCARGEHPSPPIPEECHMALVRANAERMNRNWRGVLEATNSAACWSGAMLERQRLRVEAHAELGDYARCVKEGSNSADLVIIARVKFCSKVP